MNTPLTSDQRMLKLLQATPDQLEAMLAVYFLSTWTIVARGD